MHKIQELAIEVRRLAVENPENIYNMDGTFKTNYSYFTGICTNGSLGCIVGQAARNIEYDDFLNLAREEESKETDSTAKALFKHMFKDDEFVHERQFIFTMQSYQDDKLEWGKCLLMTEHLITI